MQRDQNLDRSGERGIALVLVMFMVMAMSLVGASLTFVSRNETLSSMNYQTSTQSRYAAESGVSAATNYLLNTYVAPSAAGADPVAAYDTTQSPVRWNNAPVVLSSDPAVPSNYPIPATQADFAGMNAVYRRRFKDPYPARSTVIVAALANPAYRVEIDAIAMAGKGSATHG